MVSTAQTGSIPIADSPESMTALVPSNTALATSVTSARVGTGELIIDSSICVAVMTGRPHATEDKINRFWMWGTSSRATRTPRSPLATITVSVTRRMLSMSSSASGVSILAHTSTLRPVRTLTASRSDDERTNETATLSMPSSRRTSRRSRSSGVGVVSASLDAGAVTPGRPCTFPPAMTLAFIE